MKTETLHRAEGNEVWKFKHPSCNRSLPLLPCAAACPALGIHINTKELQRGACVWGRRSTVNCFILQQTA